MSNTASSAEGGAGSQTRPQTAEQSYEFGGMHAIKDIRNQLEASEKVERDGKILVMVVMKEVEDALRRVEVAAEKLKTSAGSHILKQVLANTQDIQRTLGATKRNLLPNGTAKTWSQVAAAAYGKIQANTGRDERTRLQESRRCRETVITIENEEEREKTRNISTEVLLEMVKRGSSQGPVRDIVAARKLASGDVLFVANSEETRKALESDSSWTQRVAASAKVKESRYAVFIHGIRIAGVDTSKQLQAIAKINEQNQRLHPNLDTKRVTWMKRTLQKGQPYGSLVLETASAQSANAIISQGLVFEGELKTCERFNTDAKVSQCYRC